MSLHFLLKAEARTRSLVEVLGMSDDDAFTLFRRVRWGDVDEVVCPHCGLVHRHYFRPTRKIWRCAGCQEDFSVTSGTIFAFHKLPLRLYLAAAILFTNAVKGISALQVGRDLGVSHKNATPSRPDAARAIRTAMAQASPPDRAKRAMSAQG